MIVGTCERVKARAGGIAPSACVFAPIVAAGAVVTRDVGPFQIVAGCPATPLRARFPQQVIDRLLALSWWDWDHSRLRTALQDFRSLPAEAFLDRYET